MEKENELPDFKTWLIDKYPIPDPSKIQDDLHEFVLRVRFDSHWPKGNVPISAILQYFAKEEADVIANGHLLYLWAEYIQENIGRVTTTELIGYPQAARNPDILGYIVDVKKKETIQKICLLIEGLARKFAKDKSFEKGIKWSPSEDY